MTDPNKYAFRMILLLLIVGMICWFLFEPLKIAFDGNQPLNTVILDPVAFIKHENIWGIFHSHPGSDKPIPSQDDKISAAFQQYKFLVGFNNEFYIYWMDNKVDALKFTQLRKDHFD